MAMSDEVSIRLKIITRGENPAQILAEAISKDGGVGFTEASEKLKKKYPETDIFNENLFSSVGRILARQENNKVMVEVFQLWIDKYPNSSRAYYSLGQAYVTVEELKLAKKQFKKALDIDPENEDAKNQLTKLNEY